jgi:hypothetical protein
MTMLAGVADSPKPVGIEQEIVTEPYRIPTTPPHKE